MGPRSKRNLAISVACLTLCLTGFNNCSGGFKSTNLAAELGAAGYDNAAKCDAASQPTPRPAIRLTGLQFQNTARALALPAADAYTVAVFFQTPAMAQVIGSFPLEGTYDKGNAMIYDTADQRILSPLFQAESSLIINLSQWLIGDSTRLSQFVNFYAGTGNCPATVTNTGMSKTCYDAFIAGFGLRALRRPVEAANNPIDAGSSNPAAANDLAFYEAVYTDATNGGFDAVFSTMMLSPDAMFMNHIKGEGYARLTLTAYETAAKLSYYLTDNPPDDALLAAAKAGFQGTGNTLQMQVDRLYALPSARSRMTNFYQQWIRKPAIPYLTTTSNEPAGINTYVLRDNAIQELLDLTEYYTFGKPDGTIDDIITSDISFAKSSDLAAIYNVPLWAGKKSDNTWDSTQLVHFPSTDPRAGLFTRAAYAFSGARDNNLIIRGARIRKDYMCENLSPPAAFVLSPNVPLQGPPTVRNIVIANTQVTGTNCASCHTPYINPLGFGLENYDAFGRYRTAESLFNADGTMNGTTPVDSTSTPFAVSGDMTTTSNPVAFSHLVAGNSEIHSCFAKHFFRFTEARSESDAEDACKINRMNGADGGSIVSMIKNYALEPDFKTRTISP